MNGAGTGGRGSSESLDALKWELEVHLAEYQNTWRHTHVYIESRSTLVRYIVTASAVGLGVLLSAYDPKDAVRIRALSIILLIIPVIFGAAALCYLGHYRVIVAGGDYIRFRLRPRIREIIREMDTTGICKPRTLLRLEELTGRRARSLRVLILRGAIGLGDLGIVVLPSFVSLGAFFYLAQYHRIECSTLLNLWFCFDLVLTIAIPALALYVAAVAFTRVKPIDF